MHHAEPTCRKCNCHLERVRRNFFEKVLLVRAAYSCPWCRRRRRRYFSNARETTIEYGTKIPMDQRPPVDQQRTDRSDQGHAAPSSPSRHDSLPTNQSAQTASQ